jgi:DNA-binding response OmpR family regulator
VTETSKEAADRGAADRPSLVVVVASVAITGLLPATQREQIGDRLILLIVMEKQSRGYQEKLFEAKADDYVLGTRTPDRVNARLAFVERKIELLNERISAQAQLEQRARQQAAVAELGRRALAGASVDELMDYAVSSTCDDARRRRVQGDGTSARQRRSPLAREARKPGSGSGSRRCRMTILCAW